MLSMFNSFYKYLLLISITLLLSPISFAQKVDGYAEFGSTLHTGDNVPLWQSSLQHGFSSLKNSTYLRGGAFFKNTINSWKFDAGVDMGVAYGFKSTFLLQEAYADMRYKWIGAWAGLREIESPLLNQQLSSGGLTWSGNARPLPQIAIGIFDYIYLCRWLQFKAELSYGWFTDGHYLKEHLRVNHEFVKKVKYHHKSFFFRFGKPRSKWHFDLGVTLDDQFGGHIVDLNGEFIEDLGNGVKDYLGALIPINGGEGEYFGGNFLGSEHFKLTYSHNDYSISAYLENYFDDLSGMGKQNGMDGLWGIEFKTNKRQSINGLVVEYYQSTNQSGPLHGLDFSDALKTGGADDYYNHFAYMGWSHWGMGNGTPLVAAPLYNGTGDLRFLLNRVKAVHLAWKGDFARDWSYRAKMTFNRTWGTPFRPTIDILDNFSSLVEFEYYPHQLKYWNFKASAAFDTGNIYGDNLGFQIKIHKRF